MQGQTPWPVKAVMNTINFSMQKIVYAIQKEGRQFVLVS